MAKSDRLSIIKGTPHLITCDVLRKDLQWLINQAEKVSKLEDELIDREQSHIDIYNEMKEYKRKNKQYRDALKHITTRKMSTYLSTGHMNEDFIKTAQKALGDN